MASDPGSDPFSPLGGAPDAGETSGDTVDKRQVGRAALALGALVAGLLFVVQNSDRVGLQFLVFEVRTRVWVGLLVALVLGAVLGRAAEALWRRRRRSDD